MRLTQEEVRTELTDVDYLLRHVIEHIEGLQMLIDNGDDPSHAISVLLADTRHARNQFLIQYKPPSEAKRTTRPTGLPATWPYSTGTGDYGSLRPDASQRRAYYRNSYRMDPYDDSREENP